MNDLQLIKTMDGSHTLFVPSLSEHYHSTYGAIQESTHVFVKTGFDFIANKLDTINILEIGMGTGLNVFLTYLENCKINKTVNYYAVEPNALSEKILISLNYTEIIGSNIDIFQNIHNCEWEKLFDFGNRFKFEKTQKSIQSVMFNKKFDLIYFDAFAPDKQSEMWTNLVFEKIFNHMNTNGVLVTYCAKGVVRKILKDSGFFIEKLPGSPGKREMTRAVKLQY